jgi:hypothetical protein
MTKISFKIGEGFPAPDSIARFITVLAMMSNDWLRSIEDLFALEDSTDPDAGGRRVSLFRQQAALHHEAASFVSSARRRFPEVDKFIDGLDADARDECELVLGGVDPASEHYHGDWLTDHRNVTFHYPEMHPEKAQHGREEITQALEEAAEVDSYIAHGDNFGSVRFRFADEVAVQWLPDDPVPALEKLRESVLALSRLSSERRGPIWNPARTALSSLMTS